MAKKNTATKRTGASGTGATMTRANTRASMDRHMMAFAEELGRMAGTIQAKTDGWLDRASLSQQIAGIRDGAARLLEQLTPAPKAPRKPAPAAKPADKQGRSGGTVDAPGKQHRKRMPSNPDVKIARAQAAKMRAVMPMEKTNKRRGRG